MTIPYTRALAAIEADRSSQMLACFQGLSPTEVVELATFIGDTRLRAIIAFSAGRFDLSHLDVRRPPALTSPAAATFSIRELLTETEHQAFGATVRSTARPQGVAPAAHAVTAGLADVVKRRKLAPIHLFDEDPTGTLPATPTAVPPPLSEADFQASAKRNNVEVAAIKAVSRAESGGRSGFDSRGRPKVAFEGHYFRRLTTGRFNKTHPHLSHRYYTIATSPYIRWDQHQRLREAIILDEEAALESASWGKFQVMGEFHSGWPNVRAFVAAMYESEANHLKSFEAHAGADGMADLRRGNWLAFARRYNGPNQAGYDTAMERFFREYGGR